MVRLGQMFPSGKGEMKHYVNLFHSVFLVILFYSFLVLFFIAIFDRWPFMQKYLSKSLEYLGIGIVLINELIVIHSSWSC